jgi:DNA-binding NarL/FixJ family response regulator
MRQTNPSPRVRLEVAFLDADQAAPAPAQSPSADEGACLTVLVVAAEADLRRYVRECLRERPDLRLLEAATVTQAVALAVDCAPDVLIVDGPERDVLATLSQLRAIMIVDDVPRDAPALQTHVRLLARPFTAEQLVAGVNQLLDGAAKRNHER